MLSNTQHVRHHLPLFDVDANVASQRNPEQRPLARVRQIESEIEGRTDEMWLAMRSDSEPHLARIEAEEASERDTDGRVCGEVAPPVTLENESTRLALLVLVQGICRWCLVESNAYDENGVWSDGHDRYCPSDSVPAA